MKYIMFEDFSGDPVPVIFPKRIDFLELREQIPYPTVLSAGYVQLRGETFACHGEARGLGVEANPKDGEIIGQRFTNPED
ncbi:hypothetical protein SAMN02745704_02703 [Paucidesulfovibrio gracilis DSM 16080]|uniref:Uncharacterized protein n=1 Tax=Paucidesulfovibrio gracilis DSM 16080 TaxID=1121449 RepID=A0A1T4Y315_9BACT|nr:hypothetical protein [Paucidesulfovibrio gracilis]SKA96227.1 hypothetical protein SAMN02745704_02703 [Paucidesulfovibrio gracilis DSM 16080]